MKLIIQKLAQGCLIFIFFYSLISCGQSVNQNTIPLTLTQTPFQNFMPAPTPKFIFIVRPTGNVSRSAYHSDQSFSTNQRGVVVGFHTPTEFYTDPFKLDDLVNRVGMYIDGVKLSNQSLRITDASLPHVIGPFVFSWLPTLSIGVHEAEFQITLASGDMLKYRWLFNITDK